MHRFYLSPERCSGGQLTLTEREAHHAVRVLRLRRGDAVEVLDGAGGAYSCEVCQAIRDEVELEVLGRELTAPPAGRITLFQAVTKGKAFENILQKATELGAARIVPVLSEHAVVHLEREDLEAKAEKWRQVAIEAIKQCGCRWLPEIQAARRPAELYNTQAGYDLSMVGALRTEARHPRAVFEEYRRANGRKPRTVAIWIGPEGDFTGEELAGIQAHGGKPVTFGSQVLRADTAAIYAMSVVSYELQEE